MRPWLFGTFLLLALFLFLFYMGLWYRDWRLLAVVVAGCGLMAVFAIFYNQWILLFATVFADFLGRVRSRGQLAAGLLALVAMSPVTSHVLHQDTLHFLRTPHLPFLIIQLIIPFVVRILEKSESLKSELAMRKMDKDPPRARQEMQEVVRTSRLAPAAKGAQP